MHISDNKPGYICGHSGGMAKFSVQNHQHCLLCTTFSKATLAFMIRPVGNALKTTTLSSFRTDYFC